jgi:hypothetical protein
LILKNDKEGKIKFIAVTYLVAKLAREFGVRLLELKLNKSNQKD